MLKDYDLWITNSMTNEIKILHNWSEYFRDDDSTLKSSTLYYYLKDYLKNEIPFKVEYHYKGNSVG